MSGHAAYDQTDDGVSADDMRREQLSADLAPDTTYSHVNNCHI